MFVYAQNCEYFLATIFLSPEIYDKELSIDVYFCPEFKLIFCIHI